VDRLVGGAAVVDPVRDVLPVAVARAEPGVVDVEIRAAEQVGQDL
jgi:hypothetical protein